MLPPALKQLTELPNWLVWKLEPGKNGGKPTKVPYQARNPKAKAKSDDPSTWATYGEAVAVATNGLGFAGVGFCLLGSGFAAFDIDDCRDPVTGALHPWALGLVGRVASYTEVTTSGTGLRIIGTGSGEEIHRKQKVADGITLESYRRAKRYIVMTGHVLPGAEWEIAPIDEAMDKIVAELDEDGNRKKDTAAKAFTIEDIERDDPRLAKLSEKWVALGVEGAGIALDYGGDRSRAALSFACECQRAEIPEDIIASCLMKWEIGEHVRDQSDVDRALKRMIDRSREFIKDSKLFEMNEKFCVLPIGGKTRVVTFGDDPDFPGHRAILMSSPVSDFKSLHIKPYAFKGKDKQGHDIRVEVPEGAWWISNPHRRQFDGGMRFVPSCDEDVVNDNTLNLWRGFAVAARKPDGKSGKAGCSLFLEHGLKIICSGNEAHFSYLIKREAFIAQRRTRSEIAAGFHTKAEGTGKGFWEKTLNHLYGAHAMQVTKPEHVVGKHNKHLETLLRLTADEALFANDPRHRNALYGLITEDYLTIEPKNVDAYPAKSHINIDVTSNADHFLHASATARRMFIPTVSQDRASDHEYFRKMEAQLHDGGYEALLYHLLHEIDISDFNVRDVPKTAALREQADYSRKGVDGLVERMLMDGVVMCSVAGAPDFCVTSDIPVSRGYGGLVGFDNWVDTKAPPDLRQLGPTRIKAILKNEWGCVTHKRIRVKHNGMNPGFPA
jgi:hypothetical protein